MSSTVNAMSKTQFNREHAQVQQTINLHSELQKTQGKIQTLQKENDQLKRDTLRMMGELKIQEGQKMQAEALHGMLVNALGKMIFASVQKMPLGGNVTAAQKAKSIVEPVLIKYEQQKTPELTVFIDSSKCMKLTSSLAIAISEVLTTIVCTDPDLSKFQKEIDPQALQRVLSNSKITKIAFHTAVKGTPIEQIALEVKKTRHLEITFV